MLRNILGLGIVLALSPAAALCQSGAPPKQATDITAAEIKEVQKLEPPKVDQQIKIVDMGKYNLGVAVIHRGPTNDSAPLVGVSHNQTAETYIILSGSGTLITGGAILKPEPTPADDEGYKVLNGPSVRGSIRPGDGYSRKVSTGDVIMIPPGVFHAWTGVTDHVDYLSVRPDPDRVLPAGYVNPAIRK
jgi:mannose-6-phosphate isomerase-like protein (cupin superfamily)